MSIAAARLPHFLVEWYRPNLTEEPLDDCVARLVNCAASMSEAGSPVQLLVAVAVPRDEIVLAVFDASCAETVAEVCRRAGVPAQRLTSAVDVRLPAHICRGSPDSTPAASR